MNWQLLLALLVGVIIFIHGIENFSRETLSFAGERFRKLLRTATKNRFVGGLVGVIVTGFIQSSTATTVITISLVSAGVISFAQSLGVIFGANVGTTITAQLVAFKVTAYAPFFIVLGFFVSLLGRPYRYIGRGIFYFGLVFFGLDLIADAISPIRDNPRFLELFANLSNPYLALLVGLFLTAAAHSSSVTTGLVVVLAGSGVISLEQGIPILLGSNIGTTITAINASTKLNLYAKRGAAAHTLFNIVGVILLLPFIKPFISLIEHIGGSGAQQIANAHTIFNVSVGILFMIILTPVKKLITWAIRGDEKEVLIGTKYLKNILPKSNRSAFSTIEKEVSYTLQIVSDFYEIAIQAASGSKEIKEAVIDKYEILVDLLDERIENALLELSKRKLSQKEAKKVVLLVRISNLAEQLGDIAKNLGRLPSSEKINKPSLSAEALSSIQKITGKMEGPFNTLKKDFPKPITDYNKLIQKLNSVQPAIAKGYNEHIRRLQQRQAHGGSIFVESASLLEDGTGRLKEILKLSQQYARLR